MDPELGTVIDRLFECDAVKVDTKDGFPLRNAKERSPIYFDLGTEDRAHGAGKVTPEMANLMARLLWRRMLRMQADFGGIVGVPDGGTAYARAVVRAAYEMSGRQLECMTMQKKHEGDRSYISGTIVGEELPYGTALVVIEDAVSTGGSLQTAIKLLRPRYQVHAALGFIDRMQGAKANLRAVRVELLSVITLPRFLVHARNRGHLTSFQIGAIFRYLELDKKRRANLAA